MEIAESLLLGKFVVQVRGFTVDDRDMLCLNLKVDFMKKLPGFLW
jgi:hypothetical protein